MRSDVVRFKHVRNRDCFPGPGATRYAREADPKKKAGAAARCGDAAQERFRKDQRDWAVCQINLTGSSMKSDLSHAIEGNETGLQKKFERNNGVWRDPQGSTVTFR